jgi:hypothetical protein
MSEISVTATPSSRLLRYADRAARWIFGLFYATTGVQVLAFQMFGGEMGVQPTPEAQAFMNAIASSGFMNYLLAGSYIAGGAALLWRRTAPLGAALLAPSVAVILLFHLTLSGQWIWGPLNAVWLAVLLWNYRSAYTSMWRYPAY